MKAGLTLLIIFLKITCFGQQYDLKDFVEIPSSKLDRKERESLNRSGKFFRAEFIKGKFVITDRQSNQTKAEYNLPYGSLWWDNRGEFGGMLYYEPKDTSIKIININGRPDTLQNYSKHWFNILYADSSVKSRLKKEQFTLHFQHCHVDAVFRYRDSLYFTEGLAHGLQSNGDIYNINLNKNGGTITKSISLGDAYQAILVKNDKIYLVTHKGFCVINNWKKELELTNAPWEILYPDGLVMTDNNTLYTGIYGGYAKIDLQKKSIILYKYTGKK
ncbi:MAG: hypothetical protein V4619_16190 [Bacteroidota bacterium]